MMIVDSGLLFCTGWPKKVSHYQIIKKNCVESY